MKYGIFGGTFDPFTPAHYEIVNRAIADKIVDKVIVIPTIVDYYRVDKHRLFTNEQRLEIIKHWFDDINVIIDDYEYDLVRKSPGSCVDRRYIHMLQDLVVRYNIENKSDCLTIIGGDSYVNFKSWFKWNDILEMSDLAVVVRKDEDLSISIDGYEPTYVIRIDDKFRDVSASAMRDHLEDACAGMSMGPNGTPFNLYLDEIEDFKINGMTYADRKAQYDSTMKALEDEMRNKNVEKLIAHTPIFDLVEAPEVEAGFKPIRVKSPDWVSIIVEQNGKFLMVKQLRHGLNKEFEEFPCGMVDLGENAIYAAKRELREETGIHLENGVSSLVYLGKFAANPAFMTNHMHYFYVNLDKSQWHQDNTELDEHEHLISFWKSKSEAFDNCFASSCSSLMAGALLMLVKHKIARFDEK